MRERGAAGVASDRRAAGLQPPTGARQEVLLLGREGLGLRQERQGPRDAVERGADLRGRRPQDLSVLVIFILGFF